MRIFLNNRGFIITLTFLLITIFISLAYSKGRDALFLETFANLDDWEPLYFPKTERHSSYTIESNHSKTYLKAESSASASGIVSKTLFNVYEYPKATWRWKVENIYEKADPTSKTGDDYPIRIYIMFKYDPEKAEFLESLKYNTAKLIYGKYPPHNSLAYIWANRECKEKVITSMFTEKSKMIPLQMGDNNLNSWQMQDLNIIEDYKMAFGTEPPPIAGIGIMNDSDDTGEKSVSYLDFIEVYR
ncbi:MAG TPA: DUF3047 domain-containing protein [Desulfatiglandales bacterium]|nr:DUF3047 domain-containing protein [Desulfatiglandales bacterium]